MITKTIRKTPKPEVVQIFLDKNKNDKPSLTVLENGNCRMLPISKAVAEVLIANGMSYGN